VRHLLAIALLLAWAPPLLAQHAVGPRVQWQPQVVEGGLDPDRRLEQPVEIEILGRAAAPALKLLSEKAGLWLAVAPEDIATLGERKFSAFAHGCTLKELMVHLCQALQECHWDIDRSGPQPTYWLHRNSGAEKTITWHEERRAAGLAQRKRAERLNRLAEARKALAMSPAEAAELEKTDQMLARSVRDPHSREMLQTVLSLPAEQFQQFEDTGLVVWDYVDAPPRVQQAVARIAEWYVAWFAKFPPGLLPDQVINWRDHLLQATITLEDNGTYHGWGVWMALDIPGEHRSNEDRIHDVVVQPRYPNLDEGQLGFTRLLIATGAAPDDKTATQMAMEMDMQAFRVEAAQREERHRKEWLEPEDPDLLQTIALGDEQFAEFAEIQRFIAKKTGLSITSDYFTGRGVYLPDELRQPMPLWLLLYRLGEDDYWGDLRLWRKAGRCLVFHRADWFYLTKHEVPEELILACREKLEKQGELTLDDLAGAVVALNSRGLLGPTFPMDLQRAGLHGGLGFSAWAYLLYASLSPEQKEKLRSPRGLSFQEMTILQREQVLDKARKMQPPLDLAQASRATLHLVESVEERGNRRFAQTEFQLRFGEKTERVLLAFRRLDQPQPAPPAKPRGE